MNNTVELPTPDAPESHDSHAHADLNKFSLPLALIALGIVFGDIGTSPLYALNEVFAHGLKPNLVHILGPLDLIFWGLMLPITTKYVSLALRVNSEGEGGTFALFRILRELPQDRKSVAIVSTLLIFGAGLLYADGIITPAISVSSAIEGLQAIHPIFKTISEPITIVILTLLFAVQRKGTATVGKLFGWVMLVWFIVIGILGLRVAIHEPLVWQFANPIWAFRFLEELTPMQRFEVLGYVMLAYTGGEALYADLGHVGAPAVRSCWVLVYLSLMLNYLGQGAYLLGGGHYNPDQALFYAIVPHHFVAPLVFLATLATCIASQALITGASSLTAMASGLNLMPRIKILHTNAEHKGQIYLPFLTGILWVACIGVVLYFKTSTNMANAYGLAVACDMVITSLALSLAAPVKLGWTPLKAGLIFGAFALFDSTMLVSNSLKFLAGGFVPISIGIILFTMMKTWQRGRRLIKKMSAKINTITLREYLERLKAGESADYVHLYLTNSIYKSLDDKIPMSLSDNVLEPGYGASTQFPSSVVFLSIKISEDHAYVADDQRFAAHRLTLDGFHPLPSINLSGCALPHHKQAVTRGTSNVFMVVVNYGYMETPDLPAELRTLQYRLGVGHSPKQWGRFVDRLTLDPGEGLSFLQYAEIVLFSRMRRWTSPIYDSYGLSHLGTVHGVRLLQIVNREDLQKPDVPVAEPTAAAM